MSSLSSESETKDASQTELRSSFSSTYYDISDLTSVGISTGRPGRPWRPYTVRWKFLGFLSIASLVLTIVLAVLCWFSHKNNGLGTDDGSDWIVLCWRYIPTFVAIIYTQLVAMMYYDIKLTQPFARMADSQGANAKDSILHSPRTWWLTLAEGFSKSKNGGSINILLISSSIVYALSMFVISPLSSSLLLSYNLVIEDDAGLRTAPLDGLPLAQQASPETINRAFGSLFYNLSTAPWVNDQYTIAPFGSAFQEPQAFFEKNPFGKSGNWTADTAVFSVDYGCHSMKVETSLADLPFSATSFGYRTPTTSNSTSGKPILSNITPGSFLVNGTSRMQTTILTDDNGCRYQIDQSPTVLRSRLSSVCWEAGVHSLFEIGLGQIDATDNSSALVSIPGAGNRTYSIKAQLGPESPSLRFNHSEQCQNKDIIFVTTPLRGGRGDTAVNTTQEAWVCSPSFYVAKVPVTLSTQDGISRGVMNETAYLSRRASVPPFILNTSVAHEAFLQSDWSSFADQSPTWASKAALPLLASFNFTLNQTSGFSGFPDVAQNVYRHFFSQYIHSALLDAYSDRATAAEGKQSVVRKRVVVLQGVGISLAILLFINSLLFVIVAWRSMSRVRHLNLTSNTAKLTGVAGLMAMRKFDAALWKAMTLDKKEEMETKLAGRIYHSSQQTIWETRNSNASGKMNEMI
jgi:hypothetical protein